MAEAVAALYAVETALEGAALGAFAVSRSTAPLHLSFRKISSPARNHELARSGHTFNIVKGKGYIIGGQSDSHLTSGPSGLQDDPHRSKNAIMALALPVASSTDGEGNLTPRDYEIVEPQFKNAHRPLAQHPRPISADQTRSSASTFSRVGHTTTAVGDKLYIWGGKAENASGLKSEPSTTDLTDHFVVFDPLTSTYNILEVDTSKCRDGTPTPRTNHSSASSPHPQPNSLPDGPTTGGHGTIFFHGGVSSDEHQSTLRDTWAFDVGTRVWTRLPDIPDPEPSEVANECRLAYVDGRLWRLGDGFGRVMYLDTPEDTLSSEANFSEWQVISFGTQATDPEGATHGPDPAPGTTDASSLPIPRLSATVLPVTTGSGRKYLLYFMGRELKTGALNDFWSFQIPSEENTASSVKDTIRDAVASKAKKTWSSGKFTWARCEVKTETENKPAGDKEKTEEGKRGKKESTAVWPEGEGLESFASDVWSDQGGNVFVLWGGKRAEGDRALDEGWVVTVE